MIATSPNHDGVEGTDWGEVWMAAIIPSQARPPSEASDLRCRLLAAEDRSMAHGKLIEAGRSPPENRLDDRGNLRLLALASLGKELGQSISSEWGHSGGKAGSLCFLRSYIYIPNPLSGGDGELLCNLCHAE